MSIIGGKDSQDFQRKLKNTTCPFNELIQGSDELEKILFDEFIKTEQVPDISLFFSQYYTCEELEQGFYESRPPIMGNRYNHVPIAANIYELTAFEKHINEISTTFYDLVIKKKLELSFYSHDLEKTQIVKTLREVNYIIEAFKNIVINNPDFQASEKEANIYASNIWSTLFKITTPSLREKIISAILEDKSNFFLDVKFWNDKTEDSILKAKYFNLKQGINFHLRRYKTEFENSTYEHQLNHLETENIGEFVKYLNSNLASIPYTIRKKTEGYVHSNVHSSLTAIGFRPRSELTTNQGRIDIYLETNSRIFIIELKINSNAKNALKQIKDKEYYQQFLTSTKKIICIGLSFNTNNNTIDSYETKSIQDLNLL